LKTAIKPITIEVCGGELFQLKRSPIKYNLHYKVFSSGSLPQKHILEAETLKANFVSSSNNCVLDTLELLDKELQPVQHQNVQLSQDEGLIVSTGTTMKSTEFVLRGTNFGNKLLYIPMNISVYDCLNAEKVLIKQSEQATIPGVKQKMVDNGQFYENHLEVE
jgi:hypothetical protein